MPNSSQKLMIFHSSAVPDDTLSIVKMVGREEISRPYEFTLNLVSQKKDIDLAAVLQGSTYLGIRRGVKMGDGKRGVHLLKVHGVLSAFEQLDPSPQWINYRAVIVPKLWFLSLSLQSRIFQEKSTPEIVEDVLKDAGLTSQGYEFKISGRHPKREYTAQYQESDLNFVSRLLEHEGIFYFFEQGDEGEKVVFADDVGAYTAIPGNSEIAYRPPSGLVKRVETSDDEWFADELVDSLVCRQSIIPKKVVLKDYNYRKPSVELKAEAEVVSDGQGTVYEYGNHFKDASEGQSLAKIRAEELKCRQKVFVGRSTCRAFHAGNTYSLKEYYRADANGQYLLTQVSHIGSQTIAFGQNVAGDAPQYRNEFSSIASDLVFRPPRVTPKPKIIGTLNARIDAGGSGQYAEIDDDGRYKVQIPFDLSGKGGGKASRYIRMAQPYSGPDYGMHFPLHKGTEVILTHIDGDPDRPLIAASVPNAETSSPVKGANQTQSVIKTAADNKIVIEDTAGSERIAMSTPFATTSFSMGAPNSPGPGFNYKTDEEWFADIAKDTTWKIGKNLKSTIGINETVSIGSNKSETIGGNLTQRVTGNGDIKILGNEKFFTGGFKKDIHVGQKFEMVLGSKKTILIPFKTEMVNGASTSIITGAKIEIIRGASVKNHLGTNYEVAPEKQAKTPKLKEIAAEATMQGVRWLQRCSGSWTMSGAKKMEVKAVKQIEKCTKILEESNDYKMLAKAEAKLEAAQMKLKASTIKMDQGCKMVLQGSKLNVKDNTLTVQ